MTDQMWVTKTESALVHKVITWEEAKPRVSVNFSQAARFSMFVSSRGSEFSAVAVESADFEDTRVYNNSTFLDFWEGSETQGTDKPGSAPARLVSAESSEAVGSKPDGTKPGAPLSSKSSTSSQEPEADIIIRGGNDPSSISVQEIMHLLRSDIPSLGSWAHSKNKCEPCRFQYQHRKDPQNHSDCQKGKLCGFCHLPHSEAYARSSRNARLRSRRKQGPASTSL
eukprot:TRINITY_DN13525_c0_g1_i5.p1 TRINITY_DN13525_c0_g1~~TRINITY_DN13525_c0_g1_i5.p1  ORF type:complete len:261 (-),score=36.38 TRINITY_DN13525_c0_g1_i5:184-858(-)